MKATGVSFVLSLIGASYQMLMYGLAYLVDNRYNYLSGYINVFTSIFGILIGFWATSHLLDSQEPGRATWRAIILALGVALLGNQIIFWAIPQGIGPLGSSQTVPADIVATLIPSPLLFIVGGLVGLLAIRRTRQ